MSIYYFSGTGNSLYTARRIATATGGRAVNIAGLASTSELVDSSESIGLVFPVYFGDLPGIVSDFLGRLRVTGKPYVYAVATYGVMPGNVLLSLDRRLKTKGIDLSAGFTLQMPDNAYTRVNFVTPPEQREVMLQAAEARLVEIAGMIGRKDAAPATGRSAITSGLMSGAMKAMNRNLHKSFYITDQCSGCGTCRKICPTGNIRVEGKKVKWGNNCTMCLACFHWCPQQAVQIGKKSGNVARYHHPQVTEKDMVASSTWPLNRTGSSP